jgi:hypothetical protein
MSLARLHPFSKESSRLGDGAHIAFLFYIPIKQEESQ